MIGVPLMAKAFRVDGPLTDPQAVLGSRSAP
jgi:hypothetical protein